MVWLFAIAFAVVALWAITATVLLFWNPLGVPDRGHRCFTVVNDRAYDATMKTLQLSGLGEGMSFDPAPTRQTLLNDGRTVIMRVDDEALRMNAISVVVKAKGKHKLTACKDAAERAASIYRSEGFSVEVLDDALPQLGHRAVVLKSDAFVNWVILFRLPVKDLGAPPNLHWNTRGLLRDTANEIVGKLQKH